MPQGKGPVKAFESGRYPKISKASGHPKRQNLIADKNPNQSIPSEAESSLPIQSPIQVNDTRGSENDPVILRGTHSRPWWGDEDESYSHGRGIIVHFHF